MMNGQNNHNNHRNDDMNNVGQDDLRFVEMYHRAVVQQDAQARVWLQRQTVRAMYQSLRNHPFYERIQRRQNEEYYIAQAYEQFWQACDAHHLLQSRQAVMHSLHALLNGVLLEASRPHTQPLQASGQISKQTDSHQLWATIRSTLPEAREQRIAYLLYHCGLKPAEIARAYPREFSDMQEIHRVRRMVIDQFNTAR